MATPGECRLSSSASSASSRRTSSWRQSSPASDPSASPPFSIDQLSILARRASSSSINISVLTHPFQNPQIPDEQERQQRIYDGARQVTNGVVTTTQLALNDCSIGLHRVFDHIQRKVPQIVDEKKQLRTLREQVDTADEDIADARKVVAEIERIDSFHNISNMIKSSLTILRDAKQQQQKSKRVVGL
ncbi:hypothetical protein BJV82DRAFT_322476 [Fennellomyces sp. T-0311]|nr:hypothetical protein BJV82DRAFT_322476 [Fennellomyces sp. T-0311]